MELKPAKLLDETMDRLAPGKEALPDWEGLTAREQEFYRCCVDSLIEDRDSVAEALKLADYDDVDWSASAPE